MLLRVLMSAIGLLGLVCPASAAEGLQFAVDLAPEFQKAGPGRVVVAVGQGNQPPAFTDTDPPGLPVLGQDAEKFPITLDKTALTYPLMNLADLPAGNYTARAVLTQNADINLPNAPGNLRSAIVKFTWAPNTAQVVKLTLSERLSTDPPADTPTVKFLSFRSKLLSDFHKRPFDYRVAIILPKDFEKNPAQKYPLIVNIGGFGTRYTSALRFRPDPRFLQILLDGAGPFGDPYQVNSANNGPYGDALTTELIPFIEKTYRGIGTGKARFTTGGSTGGWVSLALQLFYPDFFNGCWSQCPDGVDFRAFELIDIYADANAYRNKFGFERPAKRTIDGDTIYSVRHENQLERVLGRGGRWELSGRDWASWNATFGPRGDDGLPVPLWDGATGAINKTVQKHWEKYDLRLHVERNWATLGPKLAGGKIHLWVGDADDYFLNNGVHRFAAAAKKLTNPAFDGMIQIEMRKGHSSGGWTKAQMLDTMAERAK